MYYCTVVKSCSRWLKAAEIDTTGTPRTDNINISSTIAIPLGWTYVGPHYYSTTVYHTTLVRALDYMSRRDRLIVTADLREFSPS